MFYYSLWGMTFFWWLFWVVMVVAFFAMLTPVPRKRLRLFDDPLAILQRRYASGDITTAEYEERKARLLNDGSGLGSGPQGTPPSTRKSVHGQAT
ncbi:MAG TPA: SHOCT domain-containing protein [Polyangia bacterium]|jgi:putative membrane protein